MRGMASFLAGMGGGYLKAREKTAQDERQARLDAQATDLHNARMSEIGDAQAERQRERDYRGAMESALSAGKTDTGFQVTDAAGSNAFTKDQDAAGVLADMAGTINGGASAAAATRVSTGMQGTLQRGTIPGQQVFTDPSKAQEFAQSTKMSDYAKLKARQDVAEQYGKLDVADDMRTKLENLAQKGVFQAYQHLDAGNSEGALKVLQNANPDLVPSNSAFKQVDVPDMFDRTKTVKGWSLVAPGAEGQPERVVVKDFRDAVFGYLSPEKQFDLKHKVSETELARRKTEAAEKNAETQEKRWDAWIAGGAGGKSGGGRGGSTAAQAGGLNMDTVDTQLTTLFTTQDPNTGGKTVNANGLMAVRKFALRTPSAARGDSTGAALEAYNLYAKALQTADGDHAKALGLLQQALNPAPAVPEPAKTGRTDKTTINPFASESKPDKPEKQEDSRPTNNFMARMFPGPRIQNLETLAKRGQASKAELEELQALKARQGKEWWRGRASEAGY